MLPSLEYLGHKISSKGLQPTSEKVKAIHEAPAPKDVPAEIIFGVIKLLLQVTTQLVNDSVSTLQITPEED